MSESDLEHQSERRTYWRERAEAAEARAQKAEAVVEAARRVAVHPYGRIPHREWYVLREVLTAYDEPPTGEGT